MKQRLSFLARLFVLYLCAFAGSKPVFMLCNRASALETGTPTGLSEMYDVVMHGLPMDASTVCYLLAFPFLLVWVSLLFIKLRIRAFLTPYYTVAALLFATIVVVDTSLYAFWKFKLDATVFTYIDSPEQALASVSTGYIVLRTLVALVLAAVLAFFSIRLTPKQFNICRTPSKGRTVLAHAGMILTGGVLFLLIRGGVGDSTMNVGNAYFSEHAFLNHAAVNPAFSLLSSLGKSQDFAVKYDYLNETERADLFAGLYPSDTEDITDTLLTTTRPNILIILMEGFGGMFVEALGGPPDVSPHYNRLIREGVFFDNFYANSFRTDRGTVCALSGHLSYPTTSIMKLPAKSQALPSIARTLLEQGYATDFLYGGDINFTNMKSYLHSMGYNHITGDEGFSLAERTSSAWGANDSITFNRLYDNISCRTDKQLWHSVLLTLSSHEPFDVPYHRLEDERLNAFAYTDHCLGRFINRLKASPVWDNLLVICLPDHGFLYNTCYTDPAFFHAPMLWLGGAVRAPRVVHTLMNQSDMAATLLSQLQLPHNNFPYSRNVLSRNYTYPFAYTTFADGFLFADSTGVTVFDNTQQKAVVNNPVDNGLREKRGKAVLQTSYDHLAVMR